MRIHMMEVLESMLQIEADLLQDHRETICIRDCHTYHCKNFFLCHTTEGSRGSADSVAVIVGLEASRSLHFGFMIFILALLKHLS